LDQPEDIICKKLLAQDGSLENQLVKNTTIINNMKSGGESEARQKVSELTS